MDLAARDKLIEDNFRLVGFFTGKYAKKLAGKLDYDEVYSAANFGLVKAANAYEPGRGTFSTFVGMCIWHRCLMDLRGKRKDALTVSLDAPLPGDTENITLADVVPDIRANFEEVIADNDRLNRFMAVLAPDERKLLLDHADGSTQKALGEQLGISQSHVSRKLRNIRQKEVTAAVTDLEAWIKQREGKPGAILDAAKRFGVTPAEVRQAYDRVYRLPAPAPDQPDKKNDKEDKVEKKPAATLPERAALYARLRTEGANPDEAAQAAGWKDFKSAQVCCCKTGCRISAKPPYLIPDEPPRNIPKPEPAPDLTPVPVAVKPPKPTPEPACALIPDRMALMDKPRTLRPCSWYGKDFQYTDTGDSIVITPLDDESIRLTYDALKQFSEELQELLEIIN